MCLTWCDMRLMVYHFQKLFLWVIACNWHELQFLKWESVSRYYPKLVYQTCALNVEFCRQRNKVGVCSHQFLMLVVCYQAFLVKIIKVQRLMEKVGWPNPAKLPASDGHDHQTILKLLRTTVRPFFKTILHGFHHCPTWSLSLYTYITIIT